MRLAILLNFILLLSGCAQIKIFDDPWCSDAGIHGAECFYTLSNKEFSLDKFQWDKRRLGQICSASENPGESYKHIRVSLEKLCSDSDRCSPEQQQIRDDLISRLDSIAQKVGLNVN